MILQFLKNYLENNSTPLPCPYSPLLSGANPTKIYLDNISTNYAKNEVISLHQPTTSRVHATFWNGTTNPPEVVTTTIILYVRSKMPSDGTLAVPISDGDYAGVRQTALALRDAINRISMAPYSDGNGTYVVDQVRPISEANFDHKDGQGRNIYLVRFEATWTWTSLV